MDSEGEGLRRSLRPKKEITVRKLRQRDELSFLDEQTVPSREKRKLPKLKNAASRTGSGPYDEYGMIKYNGYDVCDCMDTACRGCFYECERCGSTKCGLQCRVNRRFYYESISFDGKDANIKNPYFPRQ